MSQTEKSRGAWVIHVRERNSGQGANAEYGRRSPTPSEDIPHCNEQKNTTDETEG